MSFSFCCDSAAALALFFDSVVALALASCNEHVAEANVSRPHPPTPRVKSSQVNTLPKAKSKICSKQNKDKHKCSSVYSERGVPLPVLTSGGE